MKIPESLKSLARRALPAGAQPRRIRGGALRGRRVYLDLRIDTQAWRGIYEQSLQEWMQRHVTAGSVCVDVGAAEGHFTLLAALLAGADGRVVAFEPSNRGRQIRINLDLNYDVPLSRVDELRAYACRAGAPDKATDGTQQISVDAALAGYGLSRCDVVKIDVDGGELEVLHGMTNTLVRCRPHIAVEVHAPALRDGVRTLLESHGYDLVEISPPLHEYRPIPFNPTLFSVRRPSENGGSART